MEIKLIKPSLEYSDEIMKYREEFLQSGDTMAGCGNLRGCTTAKEWIDALDILESEKTCPIDKVTSDTYIAVRISDNKVVGVTDFRHHINHPILNVWGGHIGYSIRPSERRKGYAKEMLKQNLLICKEYGLKEVLITCESNNIASEKTILANGGVFEKTVEIDGDPKKYYKRHWVEL